MLPSKCYERLPDPQRVGGLHHRPPRGIHRLGHLPGQPGADRRQHPPGRASTRYRRGAGGLRPAARAGHLRDLRPQTRRLLRRRTQSHAGLLLHRHRPTRRRPRHPAPAAFLDTARSASVQLSAIEASLSDLSDELAAFEFQERDTIIADCDRVRDVLTKASGVLLATTRVRSKEVHDASQGLWLNDGIQRAFPQWFDDQGRMRKGGEDEAQS